MIDRACISHLNAFIAFDDAEESKKIRVVKILIIYSWNHMCNFSGNSENIETRKFAITCEINHVFYFFLFFPICTYLNIKYTEYLVKSIKFAIELNKTWAYIGERKFHLYIRSVQRQFPLWSHRSKLSLDGCGVCMRVYICAFPHSKLEITTRWRD